MKEATAYSHGEPKEKANQTYMRKIFRGKERSTLWQLRPVLRDCTFHNRSVAGVQLIFKERNKEIGWEKGEGHCREGLYNDYLTQAWEVKAFLS